MTIGDGADWTGTTQHQGARISFKVDFASSSSTVQFEIGAYQPAYVVAENLKNAWNANYPGEAKLDTNDLTIVRFDRNGEMPTAMSIKVGASGAPQDLPAFGTPVQVVLGLTVHNTQ
ncbi:MAG: hypothetical protein ACE5EC_04450 [Phycisphaerae bacterium]